MNGTDERIENASPGYTGPPPQQAPPAPYAQQAQQPAPPVYAAPPAHPDPRRKSPALACLLSAFPGLGHIYLGYYAQGFTNILVIASLITLLATGDFEEITPLLALFMAFYWLYNVIDAGRRAVLFNQALAGQASVDIPIDLPTAGFRGSIVGGVVLIIGGLVLLSNTLFDVSLAWVEDWWPVGPILVGVFLIFRAVQDRVGDD